MVQALLYILFFIGHRDQLFKIAFPGRIFKLEGIIPFDKRSLSALTKTQANLSVRNFPETAPQLQQKLKLKDGGTRYIIATTLSNGKRVLLDLSKES